MTLSEADIKIIKESYVMSTEHKLDENNKRLRQSIENVLNELGEKTEQVKMLDEAYSGAIKESKKWFDIAKNSVPKEVLREEFKEIFDIIKSEQFKVIMGDTTKCSRIKYILKEILGDDKK